MITVLPARPPSLQKTCTQRLVARVTKTRMSQPLRSTLITRASTLLRAGPPARHESVLDASQFLLLDALPLAPGPTPGTEHSIGPRLPAFSVEARDQTHAACMPDTDWPISGHPPASSRDCIEAPVSMSFPPSRHFISGSLAFVFPVPHLTTLTLPFPRRSPRRSSANAARGGLTPPTGRRRRATTPPSSTQHRTTKGVNSYMSTPLGARGATMPRSRRGCGRCGRRGRPGRPCHRRVAAAATARWRPDSATPTDPSQSPGRS